MPEQTKKTPFAYTRLGEILAAHEAEAKQVGLVELMYGETKRKLLADELLTMWCYDDPDEEDDDDEEADTPIIVETP